MRIYHLTTVVHARLDNIYESCSSRLFPGHLYGLEKFWAFLKYSKRNVVINWKIQGWLNKFQRMEDFRGAVSCPINDVLDKINK